MKKLSSVFILICLILSASAQWKSFETDAKHIDGAYHDSKGNIWFFNTNNLQKSCLVKYNGQTAESFKKFQNINVALVGNILEDKDGNLNMATMNGLLVNKNQQWFLIDKNSGLPLNFVKTISTDKSSKLWVYNAGFKNGTIGTYENGSYTPIQLNGHSKKAVISSLHDKNGILWTGSHLGGVACFDGNIWKDFSLNSDCKHVNHIVEDKTGRIWISGIEGSFACYDGQRWQDFKYGSGYLSPYSAPLYLFGILPGLIFGYAMPDFTSQGEIAIDKKNEAWFLARKRGVVICDGSKYLKAEEKYNAPSTKKVQSVISDEKGDIWMALSSGKVYNYNFTKWIIYDSQNGVPSKLTKIYTDNDGRIWVAGKNSIALLVE